LLERSLTVPGGCDSMKGGQGNTRREEKQMRFREGMAALAGAAFVLSAPMAVAQVKTTNQGITDTEIAVGTHQDLSGPIKTWGVSVANGMKMATEEVNAAGGINGRKIRLIIEDSGYDPKRAVLDTQKLIEKDQFSR
jgi:ABC-type branched-subunit amino acid transport system substrate-binding protein